MPRTFEGIFAVEKDRHNDCLAGAGNEWPNDYGCPDDRKSAARPGDVHVKAERGWKRFPAFAIQRRLVSTRHGVYD